GFRPRERTSAADPWVLRRGWGCWIAAYRCAPPPTQTRTTLTAPFARGRVVAVVCEARHCHPSCRSAVMSERAHHADPLREPRPGYVRLYRGVNPERLELRSGDATEGRWFTTSLWEAIAYANWDYEGT